MSWFHVSGIKIEGITAAVPAQSFTTESNKGRFDEKTVDKFIKSTGVISNHQTTEKQTASDLGYVAAKKLIHELGIDKERIGILVFVTQSNDYRKPATACVLQMRLGLPMTCACVDVGHGCAGFLYGHQIMESMMSASDSEYGLLVVAETTSKLASDEDHSSMLFGDAGAAILYGKASEESCSTLLMADGNRFQTLVVPAGGFRDRFASDQKYLCEDGVRRSKYDLHMKGMDVFVFSTNDVPAAIREYLEKTNTSIDEYDCFALHQANTQILNVLIRKFRVDPQKVPICIDRYGNTSSVSVPLALCDYYGNRNGSIQNVLASGFGVGLAWGVTSFHLDPQKVYPIIETDDYFQDGVLDFSVEE